MKKTLSFEKFHKFREDLILKYNVNEYVKYIGNRNEMFIINIVDTVDYYMPYFITVSNNNSTNKQIIGDCCWVTESDLYSDAETELYNNQKKYNI